MKPILRKLRWISRRRRREAELREELEFHLAEEAEEQKAVGLTDEQARYAARRDLGSLALVSEDTSATWGWPVLEQFAQDLRYGARGLRRHPAFTLAAVSTLALGIGLTTAIFSFVYGMLLRPLPVNEADQLVMFYTTDATGQRDEGVSPPNFMSLKEDIERQSAKQSRSFTQVAGFFETQVTLTGAAAPRRVDGALVSAEFFDVLGVQPLLGRAFHRDENEPGRERVAVLGHTLWQQRFAGDRGAIGQAILLNGIPHIVVGVMPPGFEFPRAATFWVPQPYRNYFSAAITAGRKNNAYVRVLARLRSGLNLDAARAELGAFGRRLEERFPETNGGVVFTPIPLRDDLIGDVRRMVLLLFGAVALVLVIASANVAGLLLARAASRREEIALRSALGAGRGRIIRQLLTESLLLGIGGSLLGLLFAFWATARIVAAHVESLQRLGLAAAIRVDGPVLAFAFVIMIPASVLAGLLPAFRAVEQGLAGTLQSGGRTGLGPKRGERLRGGLVAAQMALAVVLLAGTGVMLESFLHLTSVDPGFRTEQVLSFRVDLPSAVYDSKPLVADFYERLLERTGRQPGVLSAGAISRLPIRMAGSFRSRFRAESGALAAVHEPSIGVRVVTSGYFQTMGMPLLRGRDITAEDRAGSTPVVLINESAATWMFPGEDPIGRRLLAFSYDPVEQAADAFVIVGVVADVRSRRLSDGPQPEAYFAHAQVPLAAMSLVFHTAGDPVPLTRAIRREVGALDASLPITEFLSIEEVMTDSLARQRLLTGMLSVFSAVALVLAAVGIYGLVSFTVAQRTREIGVRIALGATPAGAVAPILRHTSLLVTSGLAIGLAGALGLTRMLERELFGVTPTDPVAFAAVTLILGATALMASVAPAWRAATMDPLIALRVEC